MLWIPVAFICTTMCGFVASTPEVTAQACENMTAVMALHLQNDPSVRVFHVQCLPVKAA